MAFAILNVQIPSLLKVGDACLETNDPTIFKPQDLNAV